MEVVNMSIETKEDRYKIWSTTEETYGGVNVAIARSMISQLSEEMDEEETISRMWILCDGTDTEQTLLLECEVTEGWRNLGVVQLKSPIAIESVKMDNLTQEHLRSFPELKTFDTQIESTYYLKLNTHVRVEMTFQRQLPSFTYFQGAQVTLKQFLSQDDRSDEGSSFWFDILTLNYIKKYILDYAGDSKTEPIYDCGTKMRLREIKEEIARIFTTIVFSTELNDQDEKLNKEELQSIVVSAISRDYTDITDSLWNLLKCCGSFGDLKAAFNYMFHFVQMNNVVNVPSNKNHVATLIREISEGRLTNLCLSGTEPLELLLEIGLEKVEKDYAFIFVKSKITTAQELQKSGEFHK